MTLKHVISVDLFFMGRKCTIMTLKGVKFVNLTSGGIKRTWLVYTVMNFNTQSVKKRI